MDSKSVRVLLVEDNPGDTRLIREMLADVAGTCFDLECAERLSSGIERLAEGDRDVLLLDLSLPDSAGLQTLITAQTKVPQVAIIVLTSLDDEALAIEAVRRGAQDYLVKGRVDGELLARAMRYAIERKRSQEKLEDLYEREVELRLALESEISKRADFTRALVHELKTPLTAVLASSELMVADLHDEPWRSLAGNIHRSASSLNNRIDELFDLARGEIGMLHLRCQDVDAASLLGGVVDEMSPVAASHRQSLALEMPEALPPVWADEARLRQVVLNLLSNAIKFTGEGATIAVRAVEENGSMVVEVKDTGPGIAEEEQERIFEPYYRMKRDAQRLSGMGLGLALCKMLVELHGGRIWVSSQKGKGSTFCFSVPLETTAKTEQSIETGANR